MDYKFYNSVIGKIFAVVFIPVILLLVFMFLYEYFGGERIEIWGISFSLVGFVFIVYSKINIIKSGKKFTFFSVGMKKKERFIYLYGLLMFFLGLLVALGRYYI